MDLAAQRSAFIHEVDAKIATGNPFRKEEAIDLLASLGDTESIAKIEKLTGDPTPAVINHALTALGNLRSENSIPLIKGVIEKNQERPDGYSDSIRIYAIEALGNIQSPKALEILSNELNRKDITINLYVTKALQKIGSKEAIPLLKGYRAFLEGTIKSIPSTKEEAVLKAFWEEAQRQVDSAISEIESKTQ